MTRSLSPVPNTLDLDDVRSLNAVRERLQLALRTSNTLPALRACVATLASDLEEATADPPPDTVRTYSAPWEGDSAPPTPRASELGEEYGV